MMSDFTTTSNNNNIDYDVDCTTEMTPEEMITEVRCSNCHNTVESTKLDLHEAYCTKYMMRCPKCRELVKRDELDEHNAEFHKMIPCEFCAIEIETLKTDAHTCKGKPKTCPYCSGKFTGKEFSEHAYTCGSRTQLCELCLKYVILREYDLHVTLCLKEQEGEYVDPSAYGRKATNYNDSDAEENKDDIECIVFYTKRVKSKGGKKPAGKKPCGSKMSQPMPFEEEEDKSAGKKKSKGPTTSTGRANKQLPVVLDKELAEIALATKFNEPKHLQKKNKKAAKNSKLNDNDLMRAIEESLKVN